MTRDEWENLAAQMAAAWPAGKLDADAIGVWFEALADLEGGHVASALIELSKTAKFQPSIAEIRQETARREVATRPVPLPAAEDSANPFMSLRQWRTDGYPGCQEYGLTPADCDRITLHGTGVALREVPS